MKLIMFKPFDFMKLLSVGVDKPNWARKQINCIGFQLQRMCQWVVGKKHPHNIQPIKENP